MLVIGFILLVLQGNVNFSYFFHIFSNSVSRKKLKGVLTFDPTPGIQTWQGRSLKHNVDFFVPMWWLDTTMGVGLGRNELVERLGAVADELWIEHLAIQCELEKNTIGKEGQRCAKRKKYDG
jgi:hypothetical protein